MTGDVIITAKDLRQAGHCIRGARPWFERHGMDFRKFIKEGIPAEEFLSKGDALAQRVVDRKLALEEASDGR